ncbi:MAG: hypothetical protein IVW56_04550 [Candidatus Binataceae bacterium]|nr:hypothetical protein [Candidatus Binataceae bacterium]
MASRNKTIEVVFSALDKLSPALKSINQNFTGFEAGAKAAARTLRNWGAVTELASLAGEKVGARLSGIGESFSSAAEPLDEARTKFLQIAGAQNAAAASHEALTLSNRYGQASWAQELDAITKAYQMYGNYDQAVRAAGAATKLATATHADVGETLTGLATTARNAGVDVDTLGDKLAAFYKVAGAGGGGADQTRQLERALGAAQAHGVGTDKFLAIVAEAEKSGLSARDVMEYFEPARGAKAAHVDKHGKLHAGADAHYAARAEAIHELLGKHAADIASLEKTFGASLGASDKLSAIAADDATQRIKRLHATEDSLKAALGGGMLEQQGEIAKWGAELLGWSANFAQAHKTFAAASGEIIGWTGKALEVGGEIGRSAVGIQVGVTAYRAWRLAHAGEAAANVAEAVAAANATGAISAETIAQGGLAAKLSSLGLLGGAVTAAIGGAAIGGAYGLYKHPRSALDFLEHPLTGGGLRPVLAEGHALEAARRAVAAGGKGDTTIHVAAGANTINVNVPAGTSAADAKAIANGLAVALKNHDDAVVRKIIRALDDRKRAADRGAF